MASRGLHHRTPHRAPGFRSPTPAHRPLGARWPDRPWWRNRRPRLLTAESARWPATNGFAATSRIADASATSASRSIAALARHRGQRLRQSESSGVERLADDRALDAAAGQRRDRAQIVEARHAAGGDHRNIGALGDARSKSRLGPVKVPSLVTSVTTKREQPSPSRRSSTSHRSPPSVSQPRPRSR